MTTLTSLSPFMLIPFAVICILLIVVLLVLWSIRAAAKHNSPLGLSPADILKLQRDEASLSTENKLLAQRLEEAANAYQHLESQFDAERRAHNESKQQRERIDATLSSERKQFQEKQETFKIEFQNLANKIMEEKSEKFTEQNKNNIDAIMNPLREQLKDFKKKVEDTYDKESKDRTSLFEQIKQLQVLNSQLSVDAHNLTSALKGSSKTQGNWGELVLERILEQSGLEKGREYETQSSFSKSDLDSKQKRYQPDVLIHLPEKKTIIVDSKVSLTAYEKLCSAEDENEKKSFLKEHLVAVKSRVNELSDKNYQDVDGINTLDFVVMFMPIEAAFLIAMQSDQSLYQYAMDKNVFIVSPSNLLVMLRTIQHTWRNEKQNLNALEIAEKSGKLYDKFVGFVEDMKAIGNRIDQSKTAWDDSMKKLQEGSGNLIKRAQDLKDLGAKANKSLPNNLLGSLAEDDNDNNKSEKE